MTSLGKFIIAFQFLKLLAAKKRQGKLQKMEDNFFLHHSQTPNRRTESQGETAKVMWLRRPQQIGALSSFIVM